MKMLSAFLEFTFPPDAGALWNSGPRLGADAFGETLAEEKARDRRCFFDGSEAVVGEGKCSPTSGSSTTLTDNPIKMVYPH